MRSKWERSPGVPSSVSRQHLKSLTCAVYEKLLSLLSAWSSAKARDCSSLPRRSNLYLYILDIKSSARGLIPIAIKRNLTKDRSLIAIEPSECPNLRFIKEGLKWWLKWCLHRKVFKMCWLQYAWLNSEQFKCGNDVFCVQTRWIKSPWIKKRKKQ